VYAHTQATVSYGFDKSYSGREFDWVIWVLCIDFELEHVGADLSSQMLPEEEITSQSAKCLARFAFYLTNFLGDQFWFLFSLCG